MSATGSDLASLVNAGGFAYALAAALYFGWRIRRHPGAVLGLLYSSLVAAVFAFAILAATFASPLCAAAAEIAATFLPPFVVLFLWRLATGTPPTAPQWSLILVPATALGLLTVNTINIVSTLPGGTLSVPLTLASPTLHDAWRLAAIASGFFCLLAVWLYRTDLITPLRRDTVGHSLTMSITLLAVTAAVWAIDLLSLHFPDATPIWLLVAAILRTVAAAVATLLLHRVEHPAPPSAAPGAVPSFDSLRYGAATPISPPPTLTAGASLLAHRIYQLLFHDLLYQDQGLTAKKLALFLSVDGDHVTEEAVTTAVKRSFEGGPTFPRLIWRLRIHNAARQLAETNFSIPDIAIDVGFENMDAALMQRRPCSPALDNTAFAAKYEGIQIWAFTRPISWWRRQPAPSCWPQSSPAVVRTPASSTATQPF